MRTFYLTCYHCSRSASLTYFIYDSFVKKAIQKNYIVLTNTCVNKDVTVWTNSWMHVFELVISSMSVLILASWYGTGGGWKFFWLENEWIKCVKKVKIVLSIRPLVHSQRRHKDLSFWINDSGLLFRFYGKCYFQKAVCKFIRTCLDYLSLEF